ncbi:divalent-cation tolerance protein CutA [Ectothiorhodospiraceae bacterium 2226]|nr:divalent-cation tolerance protein CutA [Ectothiorhodospiraceae bacterium 2226]
MDETTTHLLVLTTCPDRDSARQVADALVAQRLAACVNIVPGLESVYHWKGAVERDEELLLVIKTRADRYPAVEAAVCEQHPYELPEVIAVPMARGLRPYLRWIDDNLDQ